MSIKTELNRIKANVAIIRNKFVSLGLAKSTDNLDALATAANGITKITAVPPTVTAEADDEEGEIYISALTELPKGYTEGWKSGIVGKFIKLKIEGDTAIMYEVGNPSQEVRRKVGASVNTCTFNVTFTTNTGNTLISATTFANGTISVFNSITNSGTVTIPNVVCGSALSINTTGMCSLYWSGSKQDHRSLQGGTITVPASSGTYTVEVGMLDD